MVECVDYGHNNIETTRKSRAVKERQRRDRRVKSTVAYHL